MARQSVPPEAPAIISGRSTKASDAYDEATSHWRYRAVEATRAHLTPLGCILLAVLGQGRNVLPRLGLTCEIDKDGHIWSDLTTLQGTFHPKAHVCTIEQFVGGFRGLCDGLGLEDAERVALFDELRKWVALDARPEPPPLT